MMVDIVYLAFALAAPALFRFFTPAVSVLIVFLGGWLFLPVGHYPAGAALAAFPYWITGLAVPSDMLVTKAWVAPAAALVGVALFDRRALSRLRPAWVDAPLALACLWPVVAAFFAAEARPAGAIASLYLLGCWGLPWCLGRLYFTAPEGQLLLAKGLALSALACLPMSLIEGVFGPGLYGVVYEPHPFRFDGIERYVGFRPLGFFEHGNQFGLWLSLGALAAIWLAKASPAASDPGHKRSWRYLAAIVLALAIAAQSAGALVLLLLGACLLAASAFVRPRTMAAIGLAALVASGAVYVSGVLPLKRLATETALGTQIVGHLRSVGRGSFAWRISQDQKVLADVAAAPVTGSSHWDWWRGRETRPWGLWLLVAGQFGVTEALLLLATLLVPASRIAWRAPRASGWCPEGLALMLATLALLAMIDALLNSFIFFPALVIAGGLAAASAPALADHTTRTSSVGKPAM